MTISNLGVYSDVDRLQTRCDQLEDRVEVLEEFIRRSETWVCTSAQPKPMVDSRHWNHPSSRVIDGSDEEAIEMKCRNCGATWMLDEDYWDK